ncbi:MAG: protein kinase [Myxococcales bacterium]|nr:protein kinase [Myxococcales bacterium]
MMTALSTAGGPLPLDSLPDVLPPGSMAGPWRVERELGRGGMGAVYAVVHDEIGKRAALKVVHRSLLTPAFNVERVLLEAKVVNAVGHPNIVDIFETGTLPDGRPYIVMERLEGQPLSVRADTQKILPDQAIAILLQICDALIAAHAANIVHRDLKLDNVFLVDNAESPGSPKVKVLDWGIAKVINHDVRHTVEGQLVGTPQYLSPEQARGATVSAQSDVYSLGVMAYELFLEQLPFEAETSAEIMVMHLKAVPPAPRDLWPDIPTQLEELLLRMLAKQPGNRPTMTEVARHLDEVRTELDRRRGTLALDVVTLAPRHTIIRPPSAGLAPTIASASDSLRWPSYGRARRWQWAVGVAALLVGALLFALSRAGDVGIADAASASGLPLVAAEPATSTTSPAPVAMLGAPSAAGSSVTPSVTPSTTPSITPSIKPSITPVVPSRARSGRDRSAPARKLTAPHRSAGPIAPNGTIDAYR